MFDRLRGALLFVLPLPLFFKALANLGSGDLSGAAIAGGCYAAFLAAAVIARRGFAAERAFEQQPLAVRRPLPLKAAAGVLAGLATAATAAFAAGHAMPVAAAFGVVAGAGFFSAYGFDPKPKRLPAGDHGISGEEVQSALAEAYDRLRRIDSARRGLAAPEFQQRLESIMLWTGKILKEIEEDPRDLRRARRFLNVYLGGIESVTEQYARSRAGAQDAALEHRYRTLLVDMENVCMEQHQKLVQHESLDLDVRIEVLSERLRREGVL